MQRPRGPSAAPYPRPSRELDFAGAPLSLPYEGLELRLGGESAHEMPFSADARAVVRRTTEDTAHAIRNDGASSYPPETQPISSRATGINQVIQRRAACLDQGYAQ